ncbi:hypothetical protein AKJ09_02806 [Labilithrix luteola]|uniref:LamG domain-containing protein n=1 Tax=Labilithrix luteola TaxID=1391654 RepID=A0A0K1PRI8_9BACT|nr:hypothetical protein AKJ09_02806 [Labilithrix luteola]
MVFGAVYLAAAAYACGGGEATSTTTGADPSSPPSTTSTTPSNDSPAPVPDASGQDAADASTPFSPQTLGSRLVLWLEADKDFGVVDGGLVWKDQSPQKNDAVQNDLLQQPAHLDGGDDASINHHGVVHFTGNEYLQIQDSDSLQWATSDYALYAVVRHTNAPAQYGIIYAKWTDVAPFPGPFLWASYPHGEKTGYVARIDTTREVFSDGGMNDNTYRIVGAHKAGTTLELRIGGEKVSELVDAGGYDESGFNAATLPAYVGGRPQPVQRLHGDIAELIAIKGTLSTADVAALEAFLKAKYDL